MVKANGIAAVILGIVLLAPVSGAASPMQSPPVIRDLQVDSRREALEVRITGSGRPRFVYFELNSPPRLVMDFINADNGLRFRNKTLASDIVYRIRAAAFKSEARSTTRVVFDFSKRVPYRVITEGSGAVHVIFFMPTADSTADTGELPAGAPATTPAEVSPLAAAAHPPAQSESESESHDAIIERDSPDAPPETDSPLLSVTRLPSTDAVSYREKGDQYVAEGNFTRAVEAYSTALSLGRDQFSANDRVDMAVYMSWEGKLNESIRELSSVLSENPAHVGARVHRARVYSWSGKLSKAIAEANEVLSDNPGNQDALLIKAESLDWKGKFRQAIPVYRKILAETDIFDARVGLSYALLSAGELVRARADARSVNPANARQERRLNELRNSIDEMTRPRIDLRHSFYQDSDHNFFHRYALRSALTWSKSTFDIGFRRTDSRASNDRPKAEEADFNISSNIAEGVALGGGLGTARTSADFGQSTSWTGQLHGDARVSDGSLGINVASNVLVDTARLIENRIRATSYGAYVSKPLTDRFSVRGDYGYRAYSDRNYAHDIQFRPSYTITQAPRIIVGYRFRFLDFHTQSGGGYFDPDNYVSHRIYTTVSVEQQRFYTYLDLSAGRQDFERAGYPSRDWILGGSLSAGFRPSPHFAVEANFDGGSFATGSVSGFKYFVLGSRIVARF